MVFSLLAVPNNDFSCCSHEGRRLQKRKYFRLFVCFNNKQNGGGNKQKTFGCNNRLSQTIFKKIVIKSIVEENILLGTSTGVLGFLLVC